MEEGNEKLNGLFQLTDLCDVELDLKIKLLGSNEDGVLSLSYICCLTIHGGDITRHIFLSKLDMQSYWTSEWIFVLLAQSGVFYIL